MTNRPTLGCIGNEKDDTPICKRPNVKYLNSVSKEYPIARKAHSVREIKNASNILFILRNPIDTLLSHHFNHDSSQVSTKNNYKRGIIEFEKNLNFYETFN
jgi:DNA modification methylase